MRRGREEGFSLLILLIGEEEGGGKITHYSRRSTRP